MRIERLPQLDVRVVVPRQELARDDFVDADVLEPEIDGRVELPFDLLLPNDRHDDPGLRAKLTAEMERCLHVVHGVVPPFGRIAWWPAAMWWPDNGVRLGIARIHGELDQIDAGAENALQLLTQHECRAEHAAIRVHPDAGATRLREPDHVHH